ncbi:conserved hypothetical protein [Beutenbergia cavernae DSM 12333]|uniref:Protein-glutamine gamma-glutamyltransferase-like C-terminal domain-containing protein n=1 Tax=Beutenbergia cavernae (strain ATCC BAA-8 / DSM 12333 / CCUG 43141 / JCM 11478 / NBRC 16432 / NCIMB 13614 / HKI 0122) TaxID=471853 RepID=C5BYZ8_BEUC1|nr:DUF4129 domain-containing protein [Beutenbergia cavernae]ACQ81113.1 conserved hypothetical protein [Beutenbergia cavernae DSM 12333]
MTDDDAEPRTAWRPTALVALLLGVLAIGAALRGPWALNPPRLDPSDEAPTDPAPTESLVPQPGVELPPDLPTLSGSPDVPTWVGIVLAVVVGAALVAVVVVLLRRYARSWLRGRRVVAPPTIGRVGADTEAEELPDLGEATQAARRALEEQAEPRDAIVAAWVELERAATAAGLQRAAWQTPTEFIHSVLVRTEADPPAVTRLRELYEAARFGTAEPGTDAVADAALALAAIEASWQVRR